MTEPATPPKAWADLIQGLKILATAQSNEISPLHCEHDRLTVMATPDAFTPEELDQLEDMGFLPGEDQTFYSFRFGSA